MLIRLNGDMLEVLEGDFSNNVRRHTHGKERKPKREERETKKSRISVVAFLLVLSRPLGPCLHLELICIFISPNAKGLR